MIQLIESKDVIRRYKFPSYIENITIIIQKRRNRYYYFSYPDKNQRNTSLAHYELSREVFNHNLYMINVLFWLGLILLLLVNCQ